MNRANSTKNLATDLLAVLPNPRDHLSDLKVKGGGEVAGPCPACGGNDRFFMRIDDSFMCRQCGLKGGDRIDFFKHHHGVDFIELVRMYRNSDHPKPRTNAKSITRDHQRKKAEQQTRTAKKCRKRWDRAMPATRHHPYLSRKQIRPHNTRIDATGKLLVPIYQFTDSGAFELWAVQEILPKGVFPHSSSDKIFPPGSKKHGGFFPIGTIVDNGPICFCEGFATGATIYEATGWPVVCCFDAGNLDPVIQQWRALKPKRNFIIAGDDDQYGPRNVGRNKAAAAAKKYKCKVVLPKFKHLDTEPTDFNDLHCLEGIQMVKRQLDGDDKIYTLGEIADMKIEFTPVINGLLGPKEGLIVAAEAGVGKSLMTDYLALCLAKPPINGIWGRFDVPIPQKVLIVQSENGMVARNQRLKILFSAYAHLKDGANNVFHAGTLDDIRISGDLEDPAFQEYLGKRIKQTGAKVIILDPLISFHTVDENDNVAMRRVFDALQIGLLDKYNVSAIIPHHFNRNGMIRGASAIRDWAANLLLLKVKAINADGGKTLEVVHDKSRNFVESPTFFLNRTKCLGFDICDAPNRKTDTRIAAAVEVLHKAGGQITSQAEFKTLLIEKINVGKSTAKRIIDAALEQKIIQIRPGDGPGARCEYYLADD